jgi:uncharacterized protein
MKCFYHSDLDGVCSAYWVYHTVGDGCEFIRIDYGTRFPIETIQEDESVYIVDYSITPDEMRELLGKTGHVVWIDHHKTAIEKYVGFEVDIPGVRREGAEAACVLVFKYFNPHDPVPMFTQLVSDWDTWTFAFGDDARAFHIAMTAEDLRPQSELWRRFHYSMTFVGHVIDAGYTMLKFRDGWAASYMALGFEVEIWGYSCFAVNLGRCNSDYFKSLKVPYDILIPFVWDGTEWKVSLYSSTVDVSDIAKLYGGGGHPGAAGFQVAELPFHK